MKPLITRADVIRLVPLLPVPDNYDFATDILLASKQLSTSLFNPDSWEALIAARSGTGFTPLQSLCWHKLETVLAYRTALFAMPLIMAQQPSTADARPLTQLQYRLSSLSQFYEKELKQWLCIHAPQWLRTSKEGSTQFGLFIPKS